MRSVFAILGFTVFLFGANTVTAGEKTVTLQVQGMTCASCPYQVKRSLTNVEGVNVVKVSLQTELAVVTFDDGKASVKNLEEATAKAGFPSTAKTH